MRLDGTQGPAGLDAADHLNRSMATPAPRPARWDLRPGHRLENGRRPRGAYHRRPTPILTAPAGAVAPLPSARCPPNPCPSSSGPALVAGDRLADVPDTALSAEANGWDSVWTLDHLLGDLRPVGSAHLRGLERARGARPAHASGAARPDGRGQHVPQPRRHDQARNHARSRERRARDPRHRAPPGCFDREHDAFGIPFGATPGERIGWLGESVMLMRRLLDGERVDHDGPTYTMRDALCEPRPDPAAPAASSSVAAAGRRRFASSRSGATAGTRPDRSRRSPTPSRRCSVTATMSAATSARSRRP